MCWSCKTSESSSSLISVRFFRPLPHLSSLVVVVALLCAPHRRRLPSDSGGPSSNRFQTTPATSNSEQPAAALDLCHGEEEYSDSSLLHNNPHEEERRANKELVDRFPSIIGIREARFVLENRAAAPARCAGSQTRRRLCGHVILQ